MRSNTVTDLSQALSELSLTQQSELSSLLERHRREQSALVRDFSTPPSSPSPPRRSPSPPPPPCVSPKPKLSSTHLDSVNRPLFIGATVILETPGCSGVIGDRAIVTGFSKKGKFTQIRLLTTGTSTQRHCDNLTLVR